MNSYESLTANNPPSTSNQVNFALGWSFFVKPHKLESIFNFNQSLLGLFTVFFFKSWKTRWWFEIFFIFTPKIGEGVQFDEYFSNGLVQPPTRRWWVELLKTHGTAGLPRADNLGQCYMEYCDGFQLAEGTIKHYLYYLDSESTARCGDSVVKYRKQTELSLDVFVCWYGATTRLGLLQDVFFVLPDSERQI